MAGKKTTKKEISHDALDASDEAVIRVYELGYHIVPTVKEGDLDGVVDAFRSGIEKASGIFISEGAPVLTRLAYPMRKRVGEKYTEYDRAYFGWIKFEAPTTAVHSLDEMLASDAMVLRHFLFKTVREDTRANIKIPTLRDVKRSDVIKAAPRHEEAAAEPVSEVDLDKALEVITSE